MVRGLFSNVKWGSTSAVERLLFEDEGGWLLIPNQPLLKGFPIGAHYKYCVLNISGNMKSIKQYEVVNLFLAF